MRTNAIFAAMISTSLVLPFYAQAEDQPVVRYQLRAPILFSQGGGTTNPGGTEGPITLSLSNPFPTWATVGDTYSGALSAIDGIAPYTYSVDGSLPAGLMLNPASGAISGEYETPGEYMFWLETEDNGSPSKTGRIGPYAVDVALQPAFQAWNQEIYSVAAGSTATLPAPSIDGGTPPFAYAQSSAIAGVTVDPASGQISLPTTAQTYGPISIRATDSHGRVAISTGVSIDASSAVAFNYAFGDTLVLSKDAGYVSAAPTTSGAFGSKVFSLSSGALPAGVSLNASTGVVSGTPIAAGTGSATVQMLHVSTGRTATQSFSYHVATPLALSYRSAGFAATAGTSYGEELPTVSGGIGATRSYAITAGALAPGMTLSPTTGAIGFTATAAGDYDATITATEATSGYTASSNVHFQVFPEIVIAYSTTSYMGYVGQPFTTGLASHAGGTGMLDHYEVSGSLPAGLSLDPANGAISGTPTAAGVSNATVVMVETNGFQGSVNVGLDIRATLALAYSSSAYSPIVGTGANIPAPAVTGGASGTRTFSISTGALPAGMSLNPTTGAITGTPTAVGSSNATVLVTEAGSGLTASQALSFTVSGSLAMNYASANASGTVGTALSVAAPTVSGGNGTSKAFSVQSGSLPAGMSLNPTTGAITGTPTTAASYSPTILVTETSSGLSTTQALSFTITNSVSMAYASSSYAFYPNVSGSKVAAPTTTGGTGSYTYARTAGDFPVGFSLNSSTGAVSGSTASIGSGTVTVQATDGAGRTASQTLSWNVADDPTISYATSSPFFTVATSNTLAAPTVAGGSGTKAFAVATGALPTGMSISTTTGAITGTPSVGGTSGSATIVVTDAFARQGTQVLSWTVSSPAPSEAGITSVTTTGTLAKSASSALQGTSQRAGAVNTLPAVRLAAGQTITVQYSGTISATGAYLAVVPSFTACDNSVPNNKFKGNSPVWTVQTSLDGASWHTHANTYIVPTSAHCGWNSATMGLDSGSTSFRYLRLTLTSAINAGTNAATTIDVPHFRAY